MDRKRPRSESLYVLGNTLFVLSHDLRTVPNGDFLGQSLLSWGSLAEVSRMTGNVKCIILVVGQRHDKRNKVDLSLFFLPVR